MTYKKHQRQGSERVQGAHRVPEARTTFVSASLPQLARGSWEPTTPASAHWVVLAKVQSPQLGPSTQALASQYISSFLPNPMSHMVVLVTQKEPTEVSRMAPGDVHAASGFHGYSAGTRMALS